MRRRDPEKFIYDALEAARLVEKFTQGKNFPDYVEDDLLRSGVERQLIIIGEALNRLSQLAPDIASGISNFRQIVGFRNIVVHGYDLVEDETVWGIIKSHLPPLHDELETLLKKLDNPK